MRIEQYFHKIQETIESCPFQILPALTLEKRSSHIGFIRGEIIFVDKSELHFREYIDVEASEDRLMYVYQYLNSLNKLIFRYDNTGHHRKKNIVTYPDHKHDGSEENVIASTSPDLAQILRERENLK